MEFKGFKQVTYDAFSGLTVSEKIGYLWFVREKDGNEVVSSDIYFGTRHYGHFGTEDAEAIEGLKTAIGSIDVLSGLTIASGATIVEAIENIETYLSNSRYSAGDGIEINELNVISSNTNATSVGAITIAGGPISASGIWENDVIPEGTSVQEILTKLLCKEKYPNAATKPSIRANVVGTAISGLKEVYSEIQVNAFTHSTTNGKFNADYTNVAQPTITTDWTDIKYSTTLNNGFTGYSVVSDSADAPTTQSVAVAYGTNKVTCTVSGTYSAPENLPVTNLGNEATASEYTYESGTALATTSVSVTGVFPIYTNGISASTNEAKAVELVNASGDTMTPITGDTTVAATKLPLTNIGNEFAVFFAKHTLAPYRLMVNSRFGIASAKAINGLTGKYETDQLNSFIHNEDETVNLNGHEETYHIYEYKASEGPNCVKFKIKYAET